MTKILSANVCSKCSSSYAVMADSGHLSCAQCGMSRGTLGAPIRNFVAGCIKQFGPPDTAVLIYPKPSVDTAVDDCAENSDGATTEATQNDK
jgi:hypothetical protein